LLVALYLYAQLKGLGEDRSLKRLIRKEESKSTERHRTFMDYSSVPINSESRMKVYNTDQQIDQELALINLKTQQGNKRIRTDQEWLEFLEGIIPIIEEIHDKIQGKKNNDSFSNRAKLMSFLTRLIGNKKFGEANMQKLYGSLSLNHFLYTSNLMTVTQLKPIDIHELTRPRNLYSCIEEDNIIEEVRK